MKNYIIEGMATSGKTTVVGLASTKLGAAHDLHILPESATVSPVVYERRIPLVVEHLTGLLVAAVTEQPEVLVTDRFHLTHVQNTGGTLSDFSEVEDLLLGLTDPLTVYLEVAEEAIEERIARALSHRPAAYREHVYRTKGATFEAVVEVYTEQQRQKRQLLEESLIPFAIYDTTDNTPAIYTAIADDMAARLAV